jgi:hypothetical protein
MPPRLTADSGARAPGGRQPPGTAVRVGDGERDGIAPVSTLARYLDKWIPNMIFVAPRNSSPRGGASDAKLFNAASGP